MRVAAPPEQSYTVTIAADGTTIREPRVFCLLAEELEQAVEEARRVYAYTHEIPLHLVLVDEQHSGPGIPRAGCECQWTDLRPPLPAASAAELRRRILRWAGRHADLEQRELFDPVSAGNAHRERADSAAQAVDLLLVLADAIDRHTELTPTLIQS